MKTINSYSSMRNTGAVGLTRRAGYSAPTGAWAWLSLSLALPLSGAEVKLQVPDLPKEAGKSVAIGLPGLPSGAKKLELLLVPGRGSVKAFFMGKYEVTQGQYEALMDKNPSYFKNGPDYPVEQVTWDESKEFCRRLTAGLPDKLKGQFTFRLPADAEWSVAVGLPEESGSTPKEKDWQIKDVYPWGTTWPPPSGAGNYNSSFKVDTLDNTALDRTAPVGSFKPNRFGLCDLGGNVLEWCEDLYDGGQSGRVLRGGSWGCVSRDTPLSSFRFMRAPDIRQSDVGFRCALVGGSSP
jgi:formylglycine-generating enzyme required for sulfatase activity